MWGCITFSSSIWKSLSDDLSFSKTKNQNVLLKNKFELFAIQDYKGRLGKSWLQQHLSSFQEQGDNIIRYNSSPLHKPQMLSISHVYCVLVEKVPCCPLKEFGKQRTKRSRMQFACIKVQSVSTFSLA